MHIVFDINETLLDTAALNPLFEEMFGTSQMRQVWFLTLQEHWMTATLTDQFLPFGELATAALRQVAQQQGQSVSEAQQQALVEGLQTLPAHPDTLPALEWLSRQGHTLTALTNGSLTALQNQLQHAGLTGLFDAELSVEQVQRYKPAPQAYRLVMDHWGIDPGEMTMVAAHSWDVIGASHAGCLTGFIARPGKALDPKGFRPTWQDTDLGSLTRQIVAATPEDR